MSDLTINQLAGVAAQPGPTNQAPADMADRDTFLKLLTTQLQNQDPSSPMDNEQFLSQLAQFSSLEQLMGVQETMSAVAQGIQAMNSASMANLLGTTVVARGNTVALQEGGSAELGWSAPTALSEATLTITDETGRVVRTVDLGTAEAEGSFTWDGLDSDGNAVPAGRYSFKVTGSDADGNAVIADGRVTGVVDGMDYATGTPQPSVDGMPVDLGDILTLRVDAGEPDAG